MNAQAADGAEPDPVAPSMEMLLYLAEFDDAAPLGKTAASSDVGVVPPADHAQPGADAPLAADSPAAMPTPATNTDRSNAAADHQ